MRAVFAEIGDDVLAARRRTGIDRWDEMWEGVLHMPPAPNVEHQRMVDRLIVTLGVHLEQAGRGRLFSGINVFHERASGTQNYRIPDLTFVAAGRDVLADDGTRHGPPDAVIEIASPNDESYDKLPFFAALGVREVLIIDRDTKAIELFRLEGRELVGVPTDATGAQTAQTLGVTLATREDPTRGAQVVLADPTDPAWRGEV